MQIDKLDLDENKFDINLKFYFFLKYLVKIKLSDTQVSKILSAYALHVQSDVNITETLEKMIKEVIVKNTKRAQEQRNHLDFLLSEVSSNIDLKLFIFSVKLYAIKDLLLQEAKLKNLLDVTKLEKVSPLSLEYDKITLYRPYSTRVNGALLSLIFFNKLESNQTNFISSDAYHFINELSEYAQTLKNEGVEPNQIFMLMFSESINQSIISDSGSNYEDRILEVFLSLGIGRDSITKNHDKNDSSTEFDFFFEIDGKSYGVGAKRTLRERYKQFIKTAQMSDIDVMIEITLGIDLTEAKVKAIRNHNVYLFVADEIYNSYLYLRECDGVYPASSLNVETLIELEGR